MTLMMCNVDPSGFTILTDTLCVDEGAGEPFLFHTKVFPMLERDLVIMGGGIATLADRWQRWLYSVPPFGLDVLELVAPRKLREFWREIRGETVLSETWGGATVHHFAFENGDRPVYLEFSSAVEFELFRADTPRQQWLAPMLGQRVGDVHVHETSEPPVLDKPLFGSLEEMIDLAFRIREDQETVPLKDRVSIGGEFYLTTFTPGEYRHKRIHVFEDRDELAARMLANHGIDVQSLGAVTAKTAPEPIRIPSTPFSKPRPGQKPVRRARSA